MPNDLIAPGEVIKVETVLPDQAAYERQSKAMLAELEAFEIDSPDTLQNAADERNRVLEKWQSLEKMRVFLKAPHLEGCRRVDALFALFQQPLVQGKTAIESKIKVYTAEQKRLQDEREREAREKQEREAAEIRARAAKEAADARAKADELLRQEIAQRQAAEKARAEGDAKAAAAAEKKAAGLASRAESVSTAGAERVAALSIEAEQTAAAPIAVSAGPTMNGLGSSGKWVPEVTDLLAFVTWIVNERPDLIVLLLVNVPALTAQARSLKGSMKFPGVTVRQESVLSKRK